MSDKVRSQAERLQKLEHYKVLAEKRIVDLAPDHPLPLLEAHLGTAVGKRDPPSLIETRRQLALREQDLQYAKQRNEKLHNELEKQRSVQNMPMLPPQSSRQTPTRSTQGSVSNASKEELEQHLCSLAYEKDQLDQALRGETLSNEEQRSQLEVLKQALECKMSDLGVLQVFREAARGGNSHIDLFAEFAHLQQQVAFFRREAETR